MLYFGTGFAKRMAKIVDSRDFANIFSEKSNIVPNIPQSVKIIGRGLLKWDLVVP
jgi:hypothetical protein